MGTGTPSLLPDLSFICMMSRLVPGEHDHSAGLIFQQCLVDLAFEVASASPVHTYEEN